MLATLNKLIFITLLIAAVLVICLNSALKTHADSIVIRIGHEAPDPRLQQLAAAINPRQLRPR